MLRFIGIVCYSPFQKCRVHLISNHRSSYCQLTSCDDKHVYRLTIFLVLETVIFMFWWNIVSIFSLVLKLIFMFRWNLAFRFSLVLETAIILCPTQICGSTQGYDFFDKTRYVLVWSNILCVLYGKIVITELLSKVSAIQWKLVCCLLCC
jgi:hypothetical protein